MSKLAQLENVVMTDLKKELPKTFHLANNKFVTVSTYRSVRYVHLRHYDYKSTGFDVYPTKKGVSFTPERYASLSMQMDSIKANVELCKNDKNFEKFKLHLGGGVVVSIDKDFKTVDFRRYFKPADEHKVLPTKSGISLTFDEFEQFVLLLNEIVSEEEVFKNAQICMLKENHMNQEGAQRCFECNPFGDPSIIIN